jgi:monofunctional glycosyltransferase
MEARLREARAEGEPLEIASIWVPLEELPSHLSRAVILAEDGRFREHGGIDWEALAEEVRYRGPIPPNLFDPSDREALQGALTYFRNHRDRVRGRSTLTQQLARNLYLYEDRSLIRKGQEALLARRLEFFLSKDRILEIYLNVVELGPGIFGVEAASQHYFGKSARALTRVEAASLAATLPHPLTSNPGHRPQRMLTRRDRILRLMGGGGGAAPPPASAPTVEEVAPPAPSPDETSNREGEEAVQGEPVEPGPPNEPAHAPAGGSH